MVERFGGLHVLVNVAGVGRAARFEEIDEREWSRTLAVNLTGVFHTTKAALPHLLAHRGANIVNVASIAGLRGQAYCAAYCASKAGMINFTRSLALEFASRGLRANCVAPAGIQTELISELHPARGLRAAARRLLLAAEAGQAVEARGHRRLDRVSRFSDERA